MARTLHLDFTKSDQLDPRITFSRASSATRINSLGLIENVGAGVPRRDFDPITKACKGLLIEEQRTNLLTYSEQFDQSIWGKYGTTVSANATTAPDGTLTADKLVESSANSEHYTDPGGSVTSGLTYTYSVYAKAGEQSVLRIRTVINFPDQASLFDLSSSVVTSGHGVGNAGMTSVGNGWYRCWVIATANGTGGAVCRLQLLRVGTPTYTGDGTSGIYIWGAQLEAGAFPTSYIPTTSAQVTRSADVASMTGKNFSSWYNQSEGSFVANAKTSAIYGGTNLFPRVLSANGYVNSDILIVKRVLSAYTDDSFAVIKDGISQAAFDTNVQTQNSPVSVAYKLNDFAYAVGGVIKNTDSSGDCPVPTRLEIGNGSAYLNGHISTLDYYNERLPNNTLQALSKSVSSPITPTLLLDFAKTKRLDPRITFSRPSSATYIGSDGNIKTAQPGEARFDHNPITKSCKGLLIEEQRTRLNTIALAPTAAENVTVTAVAHTLSFYGSGTITLSGAYTGTLVGTGAYPTRSTLTFTPTAGTLTLTTSGSIADLQLEAGSFATSVIRGEGSQVTRSADVASMTGKNFTSWYNQIEGTFVLSADISSSTSDTNTRVFFGTAATGVFNESLYVSRTSSSANVTLSIVDGGVAQLGNPTIMSVTNDTKFNLSFGYKLNSTIWSENGSSVGTDTSCTMPTCDRLSIGCQPWGLASQLNGHISKLTYFPVRFSDNVYPLISK